MTNPFNRADKHGAPDMRVTAPPSAETPMQRPSCVQFMMARAWRISEAYGVIEVWQGGQPIASMSGPTYEAERRNAHLVAAAPELLMQLEYAHHALVGLGVRQNDEMMLDIRAAIAKAKGIAE